MSDLVCVWSKVTNITSKNIQFITYLQDNGGLHSDFITVFLKPNLIPPHVEYIETYLKQLKTDELTMPKKDSTPKKPKMRGFLQANIVRNIPTALLLAATGAILFRIFYVNARRKKFAEFHKCYDPDAHFERMRKAGLMQSAEP